MFGLTYFYSSKLNSNTTRLLHAAIFCFATKQKKTKVASKNIRGIKELSVFNTQKVFFAVFLCRFISVNLSLKREVTPTTEERVTSSNNNIMKDEAVW